MYMELTTLDLIYVIYIIRNSYSTCCVDKIIHDDNNDIDKIKNHVR